MRSSKLFLATNWERIFGNIKCAYIKLLKSFLSILVFAHFMACGWCMVGERQDSDAVTWIDNLAQTKFCGGADDDVGFSCSAAQLTSSEKYIGALYWAVVTITSIGYGDIAPNTTSEMVAGIFFVLLGSALWAGILGEVCTVLSHLDIDKIQYRQTMDELNFMMEDQGLPSELRERARAFFRHRHVLDRSESYKGIIKRMSPSLVADVSKVNSRWILSVYYFSMVDVNFLASCTQRVTGHVLCPREKVEWKDALFCVSRGTVCHQTHLLMERHTFGEDFILSTQILKDRSPCYTLSYVEMLAITRETLMDLLDSFPYQRVVVRKAAVRFHIHMFSLQCSNVGLNRSGWQ